MPQKSKTSERKEGKNTGNAGKGRVKGTKNKVTANVKENILCVFTRLGGTAAMADWAKENQTEFYKFYARLAPREVEVKAEHRHIRSREEIEKDIAELASVIKRDDSGRSDTTTH